MQLQVPVSKRSKWGYLVGSDTWGNKAFTPRRPSAAKIYINQYKDILESTQEVKGDGNLP